MAVIVPKVATVGYGNSAVQTVQWTPVTEADTCRPIQFPEFSDKSIQVSGTFGGASVALNGSNDGTNFAALRDPSSTTIAITQAGIKAVLENTWQVQPSVTGGSSQSLTITLLVHAANPLRA